MKRNKRWTQNQEFYTYKDLFSDIGLNNNIDFEEDYDNDIDIGDE